MTRRYADPVRDAVDVRRDQSGQRPVQFLWRGRLYLVRDVLAHWVEVGAWWRQRGADGLPVRVDEAGRQVWRVEAVGRPAGPRRPGSMTSPTTRARGRGPSPARWTDREGLWRCPW